MKSLLEHPGWKDLIEVFEERKTKHILDYGEHLTTTPLPADQRKVDYERGRWAGVREVLGEPARATKALRKDMEVSR